MKKLILSALALMLLLAFTACGGYSNAGLDALDEPNYEEPLIEREPEAEEVEYNILKPVTNGNEVDFLILSDGLEWYEYSQSYDTHGVLILELSGELTAEKLYTHDNALGVYNPDNGMVVISALDVSENDVLFTLVFDGTGTWTLTGDGGLFETIGTISGKIDGGEPEMFNEELIRFGDIERDEALLLARQAYDFFLEMQEDFDGAIARIIAQEDGYTANERLVSMFDDRFYVINILDIAVSDGENMDFLYGKPEFLREVYIRFELNDHRLHYIAFRFLKELAEDDWEIISVSPV
ncbi:MAG: hypothetical protein FWD48_01385 [Oscillospiraceae bacterium]|nr:hypothetical protein [Oscillospiraceae bacterium]